MIEGAEDTNKLSIATLPVTVKVVQVDGRAMTKAVFRQIVDSEFEDIDSGNPRGDLLGWVNEHDERCVGLGDHLHLLWRDKGNGEIRKSTLVTWTSSASGWRESRLRNLKPDDPEREQVERELGDVRLNHKLLYEELCKSQQLFIAT